MKPILCMLLVFTTLLQPCPAGAAERLITRNTDAYFSTVSVLSLYTDNATFTQVWQEVKALLDDIEQSVSTALPTSDIARVNELSYGESCPVSDITADIFRTAREVYAATDGLFDPTVYPLVDLWGLSPRFNTNLYARHMPYDRDYREGVFQLPDSGFIEAFCDLVGLDGFILSGEPGAWTLTKQTPDVAFASYTWHAQLDLGGIAKGYACDRVKALLQAYDLEYGYFTCGGSSMTILESRADDHTYEMTIRKPRQGSNEDSYLGRLRVKSVGLSTSSDYNHCHMVDGVVYCHIIDPRTGCPVNPPDIRGGQRGILSITILTSSAALGDALTTALMLMGRDDALAFLALHPDIDYVMVYSDGAAPYSVFSNLSPELFSVTDASYQQQAVD